MHFIFTGLKKVNLFLISLFGKSQFHFTDKLTGPQKDSVMEIKFDLKSSYDNSRSYQPGRNSKEKTYRQTKNDKYFFILVKER